MRYTPEELIVKLEAELHHIMALTGLGVPYEYLDLQNEAEESIHDCLELARAIAKEGQLVSFFVHPERGYDLENVLKGLAGEDSDE